MDSSINLIFLLIFIPIIHGSDPLINDPQCAAGNLIYRRFVVPEVFGQLSNEWIDVYERNMCAKGENHSECIEHSCVKTMVKDLENGKAVVEQLMTVCPFYLVHDSPFLPREFNIQSFGEFCPSWRNKYIASDYYKNNNYLIVILAVLFMFVYFILWIYFRFSHVPNPTLV